MGLSRYLPNIGLPDLGGNPPELWALDTEPLPDDLDEYQIILAVDGGAEDGAVLRNLTGHTLTLDSRVRERDVSPRWATHAGGRRIHTREFEALPADSDAGEPLPEGLQGVTVEQRQVDGDLGDRIVGWLG